MKMASLSTISLAWLLAFVLLNILVTDCEMSIYPGLRRRPVYAQLSQQQQPLVMSADYLAQLMEENARRRLNQQIEQQVELINLQRARQRQRQERLRERMREQQLQQQRQQFQELSETEDDTVDNDDLEYSNNNAVSSDNNNIMNNNNNYEQYDNVNGGSDLSYKYAKYPTDDKENSLLRQRIQFAVSPMDPRYYLDDTQQPQQQEQEQLQNFNDVIESDEVDDADELDSKAFEEYEEYVPAKGSNPAAEASNKQTSAILSPAPLDATKHLDATATFHRIKPQTAAAAAVAGVNIKQASTPAPPTRHDINALINKLQKEDNSGAILNGGNELRLAQDNDNQQQVVVRQHMGISDSDMGLYFVALIAGISAATTVGFIALGFAVAHSKAKAAADVDYPAYGITGPNKDISPSGDRKLAQSAQMYHYQHQKQQIIAMENRQAAEGNCGLSDVESDDDNEEGDYTVYECPGLAPTGEMEVKNPLFLDETPMTPAGGAAAATATNTGANNLNNNITQATPQQPPQQILGKKGSTIKPANNQFNMSSEGNNKINKSKKQDKK